MCGVKLDRRLRASSPGYTLVEALAALAVIALAVGGLTSAMGALSVAQSSVLETAAQSKALRSAELYLNLAFEGRGPFRSYEPEQFSGDAGHFRFDCGRDEPCNVALETTADGVVLKVVEGERQRVMLLRYEGPARFEYVGSRTVSGHWPEEKPEREILHSISLLGVDSEGREKPLTEVRLWSEQFVDCRFDVVMQDCGAHE